MLTFEQLHKQWLLLSDLMNLDLSEDMEQRVFNSLEIIELAIGDEVTDKWVDAHYSGQ